LSDGVTNQVHVADDFGVLDQPEDRDHFRGAGLPDLLLFLRAPRLEGFGFLLGVVDLVFRLAEDAPKLCVRAISRSER